MKENKTIIKITNYDCDGCGTNVSNIIEVDAELTNGIVYDLHAAINKIIEATEDWDFDETVQEACEQVLKPLKISYSTVVPDYELLM